jgi:membrane-bound lytic murein transglycosylase A
MGKRWSALRALSGLVWGMLGLSIATTIAPPVIAQRSLTPTSPSPSSTISPAIVPVPAVQLGIDEQIWSKGRHRGDRQALLAAIDHSLQYLSTPKSLEAYRNYSVPGVTHDRVWRSLQRFRQLLLTSRSAKQLQARVEREFEFYRSVGKDGQGTIGFTGYFEPIHTASRQPTHEFRYPIFRLPPDFASWQLPHPTRTALEGADGLQFSQSPLQGLELAWLRDRLEAYLIQVQGSARLNLTDGSKMTVGFAGNTRYPYISLGKELVNAGKIRQEDLSLPVVIQYFQQNPADLNVYLPRNDRFVFFQETGGTPATGNLGVPVTPERSIATDKTLFPPGALALITTQIPYPDQRGQLTQRSVLRYVLDQDTGGAIKGAGRVDIFMGTGKLAGDRAGLINSPGSLYYLLLKENGSRKHR